MGGQCSILQALKRTLIIFCDWDEEPTKNLEQSYGMMGLMLRKNCYGYKAAPNGYR